MADNTSIHPYSCTLMKMTQFAHFESVMPKTLSDYEVSLFIDLLKDSKNEATIIDWIDRAKSQPNDVLKEVQVFINKHITFNDTLKIAFGELLQIYKNSTWDELILMIARHILEVFLQPFIFLVSIAKIITSQEDRDAFVTQLKEFYGQGFQSYELRQKLATLLIGIGVSGVIGGLLGALILSGGIAAVPMIVFGSIATIGLTTKIANERFANKSTPIILGTTIKNITDTIPDTLLWCAVSPIATKFPRNLGKSSSPALSAYANVTSLTTLSASLALISSK